MVSRFAVLGGTSRLGFALAQILPPTARFVTRRGTGRHGELVVEDYARITPSDLDGAETVICCVGTTNGSSEQLRRANVSIPLACAHVAREAGVRRFIHISSFSVYGRASQIGPTTREDPHTPYGRSKADGDKAILDLCSRDFAPSPVRLPMIYDQQGTGKLGKLVRLWLRLGWFPTPGYTVHRSMISYDLAARSLVKLAERDESGIVFAADTETFSYAQVARVLSTNGEPEYRTIVVPLPLLRSFGVLAPEIYRSLYENSVLEPSANFCQAIGAPSQLYQDVALMARRYTRGRAAD